MCPADRSMREVEKTMSFALRHRSQALAFVRYSAVRGVEDRSLCCTAAHKALDEVFAVELRGSGARRGSNRASLGI